MAVLGDAQPFDLVAGPVSTFLPVTATCFACIEPREPITALHDLGATALGAKDPFPYVPHATITEYLTVGETLRVTHQLAAEPFILTCRVNRLWLLRQFEGGRWEAEIDLPLGGALK